MTETADQIDVLGPPLRLAIDSDGTRPAGLCRRHIRPRRNHPHDDCHRCRAHTSHDRAELRPASGDGMTPVTRLWKFLVNSRAQASHPDEVPQRRARMWDVYDEDPPLTWRDWFTLPAEVLLLCVLRGIESLFTPRRIVPTMIAALVLSLAVIWIASPSEVGAAP